MKISRRRFTRGDDRHFSRRASGSDEEGIGESRGGGLRGDAYAMTDAFGDLSVP